MGQGLIVREHLLCTLLATIIRLTVSNNKKKEITEKHCNNLRYISSNTAIASIKEEGVIEAKEVGTCHILVISKNGKSKKVKVIVK